MDKPKSLSVKDFLIRKLSIKLNMSEEVIDQVVSSQFKEAAKAMLKPNIFSIELSGFGKFVFNKNKALKRQEKMYSQKRVFTNMMNDENNSDAKRKSAGVKLFNLEREMNILKPKLNETNIGRNEE